MRDIDHDSEPIHLGDNLPTKRAKTVPRPIFGIGRVADQIVLGVRERNVAYAAIVEMAQVGQIVFDRAPFSIPIGRDIRPPSNWARISAGDRANANFSEA